MAREQSQSSIRPAQDEQAQDDDAPELVDSSTITHQDDDDDDSTSNSEPFQHFPPDTAPTFLSSIAIRAFLLGVTFAFSISLTFGLVFLPPTPIPIWRAPFFLATLSLFHFLEYLLTAHYNPTYADISAYLLSHNGLAYNLANGAALAECIITSLFFPTWQAHLSNPGTIPFGLAAVILGQVVRSAAMATAGTNFNHIVQTKQNTGHVLVKRGVYAWLRHPSYFGFFWWGLGTQVVLGNVACLVGYAVVLWKFFSSRIFRKCLQVVFCVCEGDVC